MMGSGCAIQRGTPLAWIGTVILLAAIQPFLTSFQRTLVTEMMIWSIFALAYNLLFGYTGLVSLGHALFFGGGMYAVAFSFVYLRIDGWLSLGLAALSVVGLAMVIGYLSLRVRGVYFLIITLIFSLTFYVAALNYPQISGGSSGIVLTAPGFLSQSEPVVSFYVALVALAVSWALIARVVASPVGRVLRAIRDNEERARLVGYDVDRYRLFAFMLSGLFSGVAGGLYAISFRFAAPEFLNIITSVNVMVWTLVGGASTLLGPVVGTFLMIAVVDYASSLTSSFLIIVGAMLLLIVTVAPKGLVGTVRGWLRGDAD